LLSYFPRLAPRRQGAQFWQTLPARTASSWARLWWDTRDRPFRDVLIAELQRFPSPTSLLELGCNAGPNLLRLSSTFPGARLSGVDANAEAVRLAREWLAAEGVCNAKLEAGTFETLLPTIPARSEDLVFSCYALAYVHPSALGSVLEHALRIARGGLVLAEPMVRSGKQRELIVPLDWRHDYALELVRLGIPRHAIRIVDVTGGTWWPELNAILSVDLRELRRSNASHDPPSSRGYPATQRLDGGW